MVENPDGVCEGSHRRNRRHGVDERPLRLDLRIWRNHYIRIILDRCNPSRVNRTRLEGEHRTERCDSDDCMGILVRQTKRPTWSIYEVTWVLSWL